MINQFDKIKNVGCYEDYVFDKKTIRPFNTINIFYGNNGSGKTTFSNLLFLLSKHCKNKAQLHEELIDDKADVVITTESGKITHKNIVDKDLDLYVFNSKFITDHVYDGSNSNLDSFSSDIKLTSPEIESLDNLLGIAAKRTEHLESLRVKLQLKLDAIFKVYSDEFGANISNARLTGIKPEIDATVEGDLETLKRELKEQYQEYDKKSKEANTIEKLTGLLLKVEDLKLLEIDIDKIIGFLEKPLSSEVRTEVSKRILSLENKIEEKNLQHTVDNVKGWFRTGGRLLHLSKDLGNTCPLCATDLSTTIDEILADFSAYFGTSLIALQEFCEQAALSLDSFISDKIFSKNNIACQDIIDSCKNIFNIDIPKLDFEISADDFEAGLKEVIKQLRTKKLNPENATLLDEKFVQQIRSYNAAISTFKENANRLINLEIAAVKGKSLDSIIKTIKSLIKKISTAELNTDVNKVSTSPKKINKDVAIVSSRLLKQLNDLRGNYQVQKNAEIAKLNAESKYINIYLGHLGITNFIIDKEKDKLADNLIITYTKSGKRKTKLNHSLSEGEKTALAFAYFISKLRVEKIEGSKNGFENCIVVIDDPISSLDDNRLFQTANLIDSFLFYHRPAEENEEEDFSHHPCQLFILSHNLTFLKYLHNAVKGNKDITGKVNEYFLSAHAPIIKNLPASLKNFTNTYLVKLKEVMDFAEKKVQYDVVKNYLPNYIRIVLETFLAFKLSIVNDKNQNRLPGLQYLITGMLKEFELIEDVTIDDINKNGAINRLNHLKKISDHESHGSIYKAEEFSFISEEELLQFAKYTIKVIGFIDNLHFKKVKALQN